MAKDLTTGHHLNGDAAKAHTDLDVGVAWVLALGRPQTRHRPEVAVADDEIIGDAEDGGAERAAAVANQGAIGFIDLVAQVPGWPADA
jgi:hypothetical protein